MSFEEVHSPETPETPLPESGGSTESFKPLESVSELGPEPGSTFRVLKKDGATISETGRILGVVEDEQYEGGGYLQVELTKIENNQQRAGKLLFSRFLDVYNEQRIADFKNPDSEIEETKDTSLIKAGKEDAQSVALRGELFENSEGDPYFTSYLQELIERKGADKVKEMMTKLNHSDYARQKERLLQYAQARDLDKFIDAMEDMFDWADPEYREIQVGLIDSSSKYAGYGDRRHQPTTEEKENLKEASRKYWQKNRERGSIKDRHSKDPKRREWEKNTRKYRKDLFGDKE